jgi:hypothetical protein
MDDQLHALGRRRLMAGGLPAKTERLRSYSCHSPRLSFLAVAAPRG